MQLKECTAFVITRLQNYRNIIGWYQTYWEFVLYAMLSVLRKQEMYYNVLQLGSISQYNRMHTNKYECIFKAWQIGLHYKSSLLKYECILQTFYFYFFISMV